MRYCLEIITYGVKLFLESKTVCLNPCSFGQDLVLSCAGGFKGLGFISGLITIYSLLVLLYLPSVM